jgi:DNA polymerase III sliding clamp (beta) subunit (PCNA family)
MSLSRKDTLAALELVKPAVSSTNDSIQERAHIWFGGGYVYGTNGGLGIKAKFESPFECGVPGGLLMGLLNQASGDTLEFKQEGNSALKFKAGRSSIKLATLPFGQMPWRFPEKPATKAICSIKVSADFIKGLKRVLALKASQPKRMEHHAVCIFKVDEEMDLYTIIGKESMSVIPVSEAMTGPAEKIALPRELANQIATQCKVGQTLNMYSDHFRVQASDKLELFSNVFDTSEMLDLPTFLDTYTNEKKFPSVDIPKDLIAGLERAVVLAGSDETKVTMKSEAKKLRLSGKFRFGEISEEFDLAKAPTATTVQVDARILLSIKDVKKFSMHPKAMSFFGADDFIYTVASSYDAAPARAPASVEAESEEEAEPEERPATRVKVGKKEKTRERAELDDDIPF